MFKFVGDYADRRRTGGDLASGMEITGAGLAASRLASLGAGLALLFTRSGLGSGFRLPFPPAALCRPQPALFSISFRLACSIVSSRLRSGAACASPLNPK